MNPPTTTSALTDEQIVERLANEVMAWHKDVRDSGRSMWVNADNYGMGYTESYFNQASCSMDFAWNPLTNWNHWRDVELKVMEDEKLWAEFSLVIDSYSTGYMKRSDGSLTFNNKYMEADLRTRCLALLAALDSLPSSSDE